MLVREEQGEELATDEAGGAGEERGAGIAVAVFKRLADHLIRAEQQRLRNGESERAGRFQVDHELELRRLLDRKVSGAGATQDLADDGGNAQVAFGHVGEQGHLLPESCL